MNKLNLTNYTNWLKDRNRSPRTIDIYTNSLQRFIQQTDINTTSIKTYLQTNLTKYEVNTLKVIRQSLATYAKFQKIEIDWDRITGIIPKIQKKFFSIITEKELVKLKLTKTERTDYTYQRNNLILDFLFYSGLRVSELVNIRHSDWQGKSLRVHGKGNKVRTVFLPPFLTSQFNPNSGDYLFTNQKKKPITQLVVRQIIQQRITKAGIDKLVTPHTFRRSFATHLHNNGAKLTTIQKLLGHGSITTTEGYIHNDYDYLYNDYSKLWQKNPNLTNYESKTINQY